MTGSAIGRICFQPGWIIGLVMLVLAGGTVRAQQKTRVTIDAIQKAWQARQDRARSARFTWKEKQTLPKGSISSAFGPEIKRRLPKLKGKIMPPDDKTVDFSYTLILDKGKVRFEYDGARWAMDKQAFRSTTYLSVFDGTTAKDLYPEGTGHATWPVGVIRAGANYRDAGLAALRPLLLVYRPFVPTLQPTDIQSMRVLDQHAVVAGRSCVELVQQLAGNSSVHLWVDTTRNYVLVRRLIVEKGKPFESINIRYRHDNSMGWVPTGWSVVSNNSRGQLLSSRNADMHSVKFNLHVDPGLFDLKFPLGARVRNEKTMKDYIIRMDGGKRPILAQDIGATYEQMLHSAPGQALRSKPSAMGNWIVAIAVFFGLLILGAFLWRRLRLKRAADG